MGVLPPQPASDDFQGTSINRVHVTVSWALWINLTKGFPCLKNSNFNQYDYSLPIKDWACHSYQHRANTQSKDRRVRHPIRDHNNNRSLPE